MSKTIDLIGRRFGRLVVVLRAESSTSGKARWKCQCDCGGVSYVASRSLRAGVTKSCGCLRRETSADNNRTHGMSRQLAYGVWNGMLQRCRNKNNQAYDRYGRRGIDVCSSWESFATFFQDMGPAPPGTSIDRIDNNQGYRPDNCRWATVTEQNRNHRNTKLTLAKARAIRADTRSHWEVAAAYGVSQSTIAKVRQGRYWKELPTNTQTARSGGIPTENTLADS